ncbi:MAG: hypothetical protein IJJ33_13045 [Victivallales bacterium]|nr:hypothetical protein [Victivallales bacterium]
MGLHAYHSPKADRIVHEALLDIGAEIESLAMPRLKGVVLGGGYGRGEGGVVEEDDGSVHLYNDLDFYVVADPESTSADIARIAEALEPISRKWTRTLGVDVDFSPAKPLWRLRRDQGRLMVQELLHGYFDVAGAKGEELFRDVRRLRPDELPWPEAARLLVNRGAGWLLAGEPGRDGGFVARNLNKCILGAGDALLIARGEYRWKAEERAAVLGDALYAKALEWKFRPQKSAVCDRETARTVWLDAVREIHRKPASRTLYQAVRWLVRRRSLGDIRTLGFLPEVRILLVMERVVKANHSFSPSLKKDWLTFN